MVLNTKYAFLDDLASAKHRKCIPKWNQTKAKVKTLDEQDSDIHKSAVESQISPRWRPCFVVRRCRIRHLRYRQALDHPLGLLLVTRHRVAL